MSLPYYADEASVSSSPYRPGTADGSWGQARGSIASSETQQDYYAHLPSAVNTSSQLRPEPPQPAQQSAMASSQFGVYLGPNVVTPRQSTFSRDQVDGGAHFAAAGAIDGFSHGAQNVMSTDTPRAAHFGGNGVFDPSKMSPSNSQGFGSTTSSTWPAMQQPSDHSAYARYAYAAQSHPGPWSASPGMSMSQNVIYDTSSSSANTSPNRSQNYYDMSGDHFDHGGYTSHMGAHAYSTWGSSASKADGSGAYMSASQPEYQPEEIDTMLNQVSTLYKTANTKKMAEFYRDKWARMWLTCNYTLKPSIQISIPRTILHESYRRACDSFGLEPLQAASFGKVLRSQFPDVAQRRLGGRGKTRFHYCGFGTANDREAVKVKSLLEDEKAGKLQLSVGLSAEYSEARAKAKSEGEAESSYRKQSSSGASPLDGSSSRPTQYHTSPHGSSESSTTGNAGTNADDRLIASAFATLNSTVLTPPGTSSATPYGSQEAARYSQAQSQGQSHATSSSNSASGAMPRRHTVSHSYSGLNDFSFLPGANPSSEIGDTGVMHSGDLSGFGTGANYSESTQSASLLNSPASSLHGYQYIQDPRQVPSSMPFRRSCQDLPDWPTVADGSRAGASTYGTSSSTTADNPTLSQESRKAWREYESLCQALLYSIYLGPDPVSFEQRTLSFWNSLSAGTREALRSDTTLHGMILRADGIIFRQLLAKLDSMIGDDVADERMPGLRSLAKMLSERMDDLIRDALPDTCASTKKQASQKMAESLDRIVQIFEAIHTFREESMLDAVTDITEVDNTSVGAPQSSWASSAAGSVSSVSSVGLRLNLPGSSPKKGRRPSGTPTSLASMAGPLSGLHRHRDPSISSAFSESQYTWASGDRPSSSASESEVSSSVDYGAQIGLGMPNNLFAPLARKATGSTRSRVTSAKSDASGISVGTAFNSMVLAGSQLADAMPQTTPVTSPHLAQQPKVQDQTAMQD